MIDLILLEEIVARLQQTNPTKMYLFGSQATGESFMMRSQELI